MGQHRLDCQVQFRPPKQARACLFHVLESGCRDESSYFASLFNLILGWLGIHSAFRITVLYRQT